jgi:hypothetical protein
MFLLQSNTITFLLFVIVFMVFFLLEFLNIDGHVLASVLKFEWFICS